MLQISDNSLHVELTCIFKFTCTITSTVLDFDRANLDGELTARKKRRQQKILSQLGYLLGDNIVPGDPKCEAPVEEKGQALMG